jgi:hypothetical protein
VVAGQNLTLLVDLAVQVVVLVRTTDRAVLALLDKVTTVLVVQGWLMAMAALAEALEVRVVDRLVVLD